MDVTAHCAAIVRAGDRDRYLSDLFAPEVARRHLFALHAFAIEVSTIRGKVSDPTLGEVRLEWWRQAVRGDHGGHPVAATLAETIASLGLPIAAFDNLLRARTFDLYDDPMPSLADLEGYAGDTSSAVIQLGAIILAGGVEPGTGEAAGYAGVAISLITILKALPRNMTGGQSFLPADRLTAAGDDPGAVAGELRVVAGERLDAAKRAMTGIDRKLLPAFLPVATAEPTLRIMARPGFNPLRDSAEVGPLRRQWLIWRAARRGAV